jgi:hypothetical protein
MLRGAEGGTSYGQPGQARSGEEETKEKTNNAVEQASQTCDGIQTCRATIVIANRGDGRVSDVLPRREC